MLLNVSYNDKSVTQKIDGEVGKPFSLKERWKMGGVGSPRLDIIASSVEIRNLLILDNNLDRCQIELRPNGLVLRFRSLLETFALVIPFYKLVIYKGDSEEYTVYRDHHFVRVKSDKKEIKNFFKKLTDFKADNAPTSIEDL